MAAATSSGGVDRLGALPDEILQHALSFLPSREAVRTSLLARRWRHQWKSAPALQISGFKSFETARRINDFVNHLIVLRNRTPLHACEIAPYKDYERHYDNSDRDEPFRYTDLWIRYALSCHVRLLRLSNHDPDDLDAQHENIERVWLHAPIASCHLSTLELDGVAFSRKYPLDFTSCPNLETIKMNRCSSLIHINMWSRSVRCLCITNYDFYSYEGKPRALIYVPSLLYLELTGGRGLVPAFESMPLLQTASIKLDHRSNRDDKDGSLLLGGLSDATHLELFAEPQALAYRKDLIQCTAFSKLKTLSLNDWCVEPDFGPLLHFLRRSPGLEKLCLQLSKPYQHAEETDGSYDSTEPFLASKKLRVVKIRCHASDERVHRILKVMSSYGIPGEQINVKERNWSSESSYSDSEQSDYSYSDTDQSD